MTGRLAGRLDRVAARLRDATECRACRGWAPATYCDDRGRCLRPEVCPACGRRAPIIQPVIIVGVDLDKV